MIAIGVDPGKTTGFAVWDCRAEEFLELQSYTFWEAYHEGMGWWARARMEERRMLIRVEDPSGNKPVFGRGHRGRKNLKIAQNVGMNKKEAQLLISGWRRAGIPVQGITPRSSKWDARRFRKITGYQGRTNEHKRDAARMVYGLRTMPDEQYQQLLNKEIA